MARYRKDNLDEYTQTEIATALGITAAQVNQSYHSALEKLRPLLEEMGVSVYDLKDIEGLA